MMCSKLQRSSRAFGLYSSIFLLALVSCFAQVRNKNDPRGDPSGRTPRAVLTSVAKEATPQSAVRLMESIARSSSTSLTREHATPAAIFF